MWNPFKKPGYVDPLDHAHGLVSDALDVFETAKANLREAVKHYESVSASAAATAARAAARKSVADQSARNAATVADKIDALTSS